jgi:FKBP-type peptidyl-prolyl cis-trans isomerase FkpA
VKTGKLLSLILITFCLFNACEEENPVADKNSEADAYLAENAKRDGVIVTASGLQYEIVTEGEGTTPTPADSIVIHYVGKKTNGSEFDSSYSRGRPSTFLLSALISGWVEGLQLMKVGSKYKFVIPPNLAYGQYGSGSIGPYEVLLFEVELLDIL